MYLADLDALAKPLDMTLSSWGWIEGVHMATKFINQFNIKADILASTYAVTY